MRTRRVNSLDPDRIQARRTARFMVEEFRAASRRFRQLKQDANPALPLKHSNRMQEAANKLEMLGHKEIAAVLKQWHEALVSARTETRDDAHSSRCWARGLSAKINRLVEAIR